MKKKELAEQIHLLRKRLEVLMDKVESLSYEVYNPKLFKYNDIVIVTIYKEDSTFTTSGIIKSEGKIERVNSPFLFSDSYWNRVYIVEIPQLKEFYDLPESSIKPYTDAEEINNK